MNSLISWFNIKCFVVTLLFQGEFQIRSDGMYSWSSHRTVFNFNVLTTGWLCFGLFMRIFWVKRVAKQGILVIERENSLWLSHIQLAKGFCQLKPLVHLYQKELVGNYVCCPTLFINKQSYQLLCFFPSCEYQICWHWIFSCTKPVCRIEVSSSTFQFRPLHLC